MRIRNFLLLTGIVSSASASTPVPPVSSFELTATAADFDRYFPGYLANGYLSAMTGPRGTEPVRSYVAGLMDYAPGDVSRPAAIPGWSSIDYASGPPGAGATWLNRASLDAHGFQDYQQTLDMHGATLTTRYRFVDHDHETGIETVSFISQASPHLAATEMTLSPAFSGEVQMSFSLTLWQAHQPRFALGQITGSEMEDELAARDLRFAPVAPATPDRAAIWYPGHVAVTVAHVDARQMTLGLEGRAEQGLAMAEAAAIGLPAGLVPSEVRVEQNGYRLALTLRFHVQQGHRYSFSRVAAVSRAGWGGDNAADLELATAARARGFAVLLAEHRAAWARLWQADIRILGDAHAQQVVHSDLYYLLASSTADTAWPIGACGLTPGYAGHAFWDSDNWIMPALLLLHPERAKSLVMFRTRTLASAQARAKAHGFAGAMYPWEADPETGSEQTPHFAQVLSGHEIHVNADIALAQWQYWLATGDRAWLRQSGWPVIREVARFWASRAQRDSARDRYDIAHVTSVDESYVDVLDDTYTNLAARRALRVAVLAATLVGERPDPAWAQIGDKLYIPFDTAAQHHLYFDPSVPHRADSWGGGALPMLSLPSLDEPMTDAVRRNDFALAMSSIAHEQEPNSMGPPPVSLMAAASGDPIQAVAWLNRNLSHALLKPPFNVRTETALNNTGYFVTASGGFIQNILFGVTGMRLRESGMQPVYPPLLPAGWTSVAFTGLHLRGRVLDIAVTRGTDGAPRVTEAARR